MGARLRILAPSFFPSSMVVAIKTSVVVVDTLGFNGIRIQIFISMRIPIRIRIQEAKPVRIQAHPDPCQTKSQKFEFLHDKYRSTNILMKVQKALWKAETRFTCKFWSFLCFWILIRIRISYVDPDPRKPNECGSRWIRIRIHSTDKTPVFVFSVFLSVSSFPLSVLVVPDAVLFSFLLFSYFLCQLPPIAVLVLFLPDAVALYHPLLSLLAVLLFAWNEDPSDMIFSFLRPRRLYDIDEPAYLAGTENLPYWGRKEEKIQILIFLCCKLWFLAENRSYWDHSNKCF
jgi:hypothetical protein